MTSQIERTITDYYPHIDAVDVDWVLDLFAEDAVYERADATYRGRKEISRFFREDRQIRGEHVIDTLHAHEPSGSVYVTGRFVGRGADGDPRQVGFADVWRFDQAGKVVKRQSFLALGHAYVER